MQRGEGVEGDLRRHRRGQMWEGEVGAEDLLLLLLLRVGVGLEVVVRMCDPLDDLEGEAVHWLQVWQEGEEVGVEQKSLLLVSMAVEEVLKALKEQQGEEVHLDVTAVQAAAEVACERMPGLCSALEAGLSWLSAEQGRPHCLVLLSVPQSPL